MLAELFLWLATPAGRAARRSGHLSAAVRLWTRASRAGDAWEPHELRCHAAIRHALLRVANGGTVVVLGSGLVLDVPLTDLQAQFHTVVLIDAVHLLPVRLQALFWRRTQLVSADLNTPPGGDLAGFLAGFKPSLVISANVLSQIPLARGIDDPRAAIDRHLAGLAALPCPVLLLTDLDERRLDASGREEDYLDLLRGRRLPPPDAAWDWLLAPYGDIADDACLVHRAGSWFFADPSALQPPPDKESPRTRAAAGGF